MTNKMFCLSQVRKMTSVILAVGQGAISADKVQWMLDYPQQACLENSDLYNIPSYGLYLKQVHYPPQG